ncbi:uncharacterized protein CLUP02_04555 [Colletotrichum lupini]|uniref:Uncharacterized protein n=1 Tax=Colletotrichum lupini TaxID=145971 RepID=A0A9Q8SLJ6_9PEZI|nr:uncharacterized protein CLUP02_04555 [Colletotrichum lupini]UQC79076.1 hypothetical protein CLUP02_04555 [Colletotrichum lupini]
MNFIDFAYYTGHRVIGSTKASTQFLAHTSINEAVKVVQIVIITFSQESKAQFYGKRIRLTYSFPASLSLILYAPGPSWAILKVPSLNGSEVGPGDTDPLRTFRAPELSRHSPDIN